MRKHRVLVVDDYPGARYRRMRVLLEDGGFEVAEEVLGRAAVKRAVDDAGAEAGTGAFDLFLVDLHLQDISGLEVCRALKSHPRTADTPVLIISAVAEEEEATRLAAAHGAAGFVPDSADAATLVSSVRVALRDRRRPA